MDLLEPMQQLPKLGYYLFKQIKLYLLNILIYTSDTNGQLVVLGGAVINNSSTIDMVTNQPLANMTDIVVLDPRSCKSNLIFFFQHS